MSAISKKYWIEKNMAVYHIHFIDQKMVVDEILKTKVPMIKNGQTVMKDFIGGVQVHYLSNITGQPYNATYHSSLLRPWQDSRELREQEVLKYQKEKKINNE